MPLSLFELLVLCVGCWLLWKIARKAWQRAELMDKVEEKVKHDQEVKEKVENKLHDLEVEKEVASRVVIDKKEVEAYRKKLRDLDNL